MISRQFIGNGTISFILDLSYLPCGEYSKSFSNIKEPLKNISAKLYGSFDW
jgi:hypothetical protein